MIPKNILYVSPLWLSCGEAEGTETTFEHSVKAFHNIRLLPLYFSLHNHKEENTTIVCYSHLEKWLIVSFSISSSSDTICSAQIGNNLHYSVESRFSDEVSEMKEQCSLLVTRSRGVVFKLAIDLNRIIQYGSFDLSLTSCNCLSVSVESMWLLMDTDD